MKDIDKIVSNHWELPVEQALRVEALSHNMNFADITTEQSLHDILSSIIEDEKDILRIMNIPPFNTVKDKRFQISITYWFNKPIWKIELEGLDGNENTIFTERGYWNWYSIEEEAIEKYKQKLKVLIDDPYHYADLSCMDVKVVRIRLMDTAYNHILEEKYFRI